MGGVMDAIERDAARYRWLRENSNLVAVSRGEIAFACGNWKKDDADKAALDAAIDGKIQKSNGGGA